MLRVHRTCKMGHQRLFHCISWVKVQNLQFPKCRSKIFRHFYPPNCSRAKYPCSHRTMDSWSNRVKESHRIHLNGRVFFRCHFPWVFGPSREWLDRWFSPDVVESILFWFFADIRGKSYHSQREQIQSTFHKSERQSCSNQTNMSILCRHKLLVAWNESYHTQ